MKKKQKKKKQHNMKTEKLSLPFDEMYWQTHLRKWLIQESN